jgi:hypothetical protein
VTLWILGGIHPEVDFDVERHPSHREDHIDLPSIFSISYTDCSSKGTLIQVEGIASEET